MLKSPPSRWNNSTDFQYFRTENGSSQGQNLALAVFCVPSLLDSGRRKESEEVGELRKSNLSLREERRKAREEKARLDSEVAALKVPPQGAGCRV